MIPSSIRYLVFSDVHFGHRINPTVSIAENLYKLIGPYRDQHLDIIFIAGDLFDRLIDNSMADNGEVHIWMCWLLRFCEENQIRLRVLEGTRSHDRGQSSQFETIYQIAQTNLDYRYIPYLYIEHMEDLDIHVLYVPDEWHEDPQVTFKQVQGLLAEQQLSQVDLAIMHGQFGYQLKLAPASIPRHQESDYLAIVRHYVHIGHVHVYSQFERIVAQGSVDRLAHGEEDPKGMVFAEIRKDGTREHHFIVNKNAMIFKTIRIKASELEESIAYLDRQIAKLPMGSAVRIQAKKNHPLYQVFGDLEIRYSQYRLSKKTTDQPDEEVYDTYIDTTHYQTFTISRENIRGLIADELTSNSKMTPVHLTCMQGIFESEQI